MALLLAATLVGLENPAKLQHSVGEVASRKGPPPKRENTTDGEELNGNLCQFLLDLQPGTPSCNLMLEKFE
jgi:hypothetical protein